MGRLVHQREFLAFKNEMEGDVANLKLDKKELSLKVDGLYRDFFEFKDTGYNYFDSIVGAIKDIRDEQIFMHRAIIRLEEKVDKHDGLFAEILARLPKKRKKA